VSSIATPPATPAAAPAAPNTDTRAERAVAQLEHQARGATAWAVRWWWHFRFIFFVVFLLLAVVLFWLGLVSLVLATLRFFIAGLATVLAWLGGKGPHGTGPGTAAELRDGLRTLWRQRATHYHDLARPIVRGTVALRDMMVRWWHWSPGHKLLALVVSLVFIGVPVTYIVPRPHLVQILDDNVLEHHNVPNGQLRYLIHAASLTDPGQLHEYTNERAVWLGKIDPQGLKNKLVVGRYYRLWVIGIRWNFLPTLFPNIIAATEVDASGKAIAAPTGLIPYVPSTPLPPR
jgi:hypothetical protein